MKYRIATQCLHEGWKPANGEARQLPIYQSTTFKYDTSDAMTSPTLWRCRFASGKL